MLYTGDFVLRYYVRFSQIRSHLWAMYNLRTGPDQRTHTKYSPSWSGPCFMLIVIFCGPSPKLLCAVRDSASSPLGYFIFLFIWLYNAG